MYELTQSEISTWQLCQRMWWLKHFRRLAPVRVEKKSPASVGTYVHAKLRQLYDEKSEFEEPENVEPETLDLVNTMLSTFIAWREECGLDERISLVSSVEEAFHAPLLGGAIRLQGIPDLVYQDPSGQLCVRDWKTTGQLAQTLASAPTSPQLRTYALLLDNYGFDVANVELVVLRRIVPSNRTKPPYADMVRLTMTPAVLLRHRENLEAIAQDLLSKVWQLETVPLAQQRRFVPPTIGTHCSWRCPFAAICSSFDDGGDAEGGLLADFEEHDPLARYHETTKE
jgi:hypothetical protein